jgi:hypothetical protein
MWPLIFLVKVGSRQGKVVDEGGMMGSGGLE